jgi:hypothetical protein
MRLLGVARHGFDSSRQGDLDMSEPRLQYVANRNPSITDTITVDGVAQDLTGCTVKFKMRAVGSSTLKVDAAAVDRVRRRRHRPLRLGRRRRRHRRLLPRLVGGHDASGKTQDKPEFLLEFRGHTASSYIVELAEVGSRWRRRTPTRPRRPDPAADPGRDAKAVADFAQREFVPTTAATRKLPGVGRL